MQNNTLKKGFYKHFKRDLLHGTTGNDFLYQVLGVSIDAGNDERCVVYRPLYPYENERADFFSGSISEFTEKVEIKGIKKDRFQLITDAAEIERLNCVSREMYGE